MSQVIPSPAPSANIGPRLRLIRDEEAPPYDAEPEPVSRSASPTGMILRSCGPTAVAVWHIAVDNHACGEPNTYAVLEEQCELSTRQMRYVCKRLIDAGFLTTLKGGGRGKETILIPVNPLENSAINSAEKHAENCRVSPETLQQTLQQTLQSPPYNPPGVLTSEREEVLNTPPTPSRRAKPEPYTEGFEQFWTAYPRRDDRKGALKVWSRLKPDADLLAVMLQAIQAQGLAQRERRYIPLPTTWLNGERWTDETTALTLTAANGHHPIITDRGAFDPWGGYKEQSE